MSPNPQAEPPRFVPDEPLPPYTFVPGRRPHPISDPRGHSYGCHQERPPAPDPRHWIASRTYLRGIDLFNHGYYWEAHEAWEGLWHACGRRGPTADFFRGLIHLAAAGVKVREGRPDGVRSHGARAARCFRNLSDSCFGLAIAELVQLAEVITARMEEWPASPNGVAVFDFLVPREGGTGVAV